MPPSSNPSNDDALFKELLTATQIMGEFPHAWCVCGGWAIALFINRVSRHHKDIDFAIWRKDQLALWSYLVSQQWTLEKAVDSQLFPWIKGEFLELPIHAIWCNNLNAQPSFIEILLNEVDDDHFLFRRALSITYPLENTIISSALGVPILAPEIVLLYKARNASDKRNHADFEAVLPHLERDRRSWLCSALAQVHPGHEWLYRL